jgi:N-terminal acetyltransferase B complex catalytic subunit
MNAVNLDRYTENFQPNYYLNYFAKSPELIYVTQSSNGTVSGLMMGKVEGVDDLYHAHVSALSVARQHRRSNIAKLLMAEFESLAERVYDTYFSDLYVRPSNCTAVLLYKTLGYIVYRRVLNYYTNEDAYDMRKSLHRDATKKSMVPLPHPTNPTNADAG